MSMYFGFLWFVTNGRTSVMLGLVAVFFSMVIGFGLIICVSWRLSCSPQLSPFAGAASFGLFIGLVAGLSGSPIASVVITSISAIVAAIAPRYFGESSGRTEPLAVYKLVDCVPLLFPLASSAVLGIVLGLFLRVNDAFYFERFRPKVSYREQLLDLGFTNQQVSRILDRIAETAPTSLLEPPRYLNHAASGEPQPSRVTALASPPRTSFKLAFDEASSLDTSSFEERLKYLQPRLSDSEKKFVSWIAKELHTDPSKAWHDIGRFANFSDNYQVK